MCLCSGLESRSSFCNKYHPHCSAIDICKEEGCCCCCSGSMSISIGSVTEPPKLSRTDWGLHCKRSDCSCRLIDDDDAAVLKVLLLLVPPLLLPPSSIWK